MVEIDKARCGSGISFLRILVSGYGSEGIQIGKEEGMHIGKAKTVRKFKAAGVPMSLIMEATGMTEAQIKAL